MPGCIQNRKTGVVHWRGIDQCGDVTNHGRLNHWEIIGEFASLFEASQSERARGCNQPPRSCRNCLNKEKG